MNNTVSIMPPVLLLAFNRPHLTRIVLERIRESKPPIVYAACDGPRPGNNQDAEAVQLVHSVISETVDWDCNLKKLFRTKNLGCRDAVSSAVSWFFDEVEEGIVLEDDCLPDPSFFRFCAELLKRYRNDERIMHISGNNFRERESASRPSYFFSRINHCWGWATWARAWAMYDANLNSFPRFKEERRIRDVFPDRYVQNYTIDKLEAVYRGAEDSWAYIWNYSCYAQNGLTCRPCVNLVQNIGFRKGVTHTTNTRDPLARTTVKSIAFPLVHPEFVVPDSEADRRYYRRHRYYMVNRWLLPVLKHLKLFNIIRWIYWRIVKW